MTNQDKYNDAFPTRLRTLMAYNRLNVKTLSKKVGICRQSLHDYSVGKSNPSVKNVITLAMAFGVSVDYLVGVTDVDQYSYHARRGELRTLIPCTRNIDNKSGLFDPVYGIFIDKPQ